MAPSLRDDPTGRSIRARVAAYSMHARHDPRETTARARQAFLSAFERTVDPDGALPPAERARRAEAAKRAHFARLAYLRHRRAGARK